MRLPRAIAAAALLAAAAPARPARADVAASKEVADREAPVIVAASKLAKALQEAPDRKALDAAAGETATAAKAFAAYLDAHPKERSAELTRIAVAADKLLQTVARLQGELDQKASGVLLQQTAIDALHRFNELLDAHDGKPAPKQLAIPDALREKFVRMVEKVAADAQANQGKCTAMGDALVKHAPEDGAIVKALQDIDDARPQDQREAERAKKDPRGAARLEAAAKKLGPLVDCKDDQRVAAYLEGLAAILMHD